MSTKILPLLHLNGSGTKNLLPPAENALDALAVAYPLLREMAPNQRDYYPLGEEAWTAARDEHIALCAKLREVLEAVESHVEHIREKSKK
jgi:hypothetical protein